MYIPPPNVKIKGLWYKCALIPNELITCVLLVIKSPS